MALLQLQIAAEDERARRVKRRTPHDDPFGVGRLIAETATAAEEL